MEDFQCIVLKSPKCYAEDRTVLDKTCRTSTTFDCAAVTAPMDHGYGSSDAYGSSSSGHADSYGASSSDDSYGSHDSYASHDAYGSSSYEDKKCKRSYDTKCYTPPRTVTSQKCEVREEKVCELEQRQQPKQIKKYVYTKQCRSVPKTVCENADVKQLVPSCVPTMRKECHYNPVEKCEQVPKQFCYKVPKRITKQKCETVKKASYSAAEPSTEAAYESGYDAGYSK